jgi:hypothetical protein
MHDGFPGIFLTFPRLYGGFPRFRVKKGKILGAEAVPILNAQRKKGPFRPRDGGFKSNPYNTHLIWKWFADRQNMRI